jgi:hypothetical protein
LLITYSLTACLNLLKESIEERIEHYETFSKISSGMDKPKLVHTILDGWSHSLDVQYL